MRSRIGLAILLAVTCSNGCGRAPEEAHSNPAGTTERVPNGSEKVTDNNGPALKLAFTITTAFTGSSGQTANDLTRVALSKDGQILAVSGYTRGNNIQVWDLRTKEKIGEFHTEYMSPKAAISPDGGAIFSAYKPDRLIMCDPRTGTEKASLALARDDFAIFLVLNFSPDGDTATAVTSKRIYGWETATGKPRYSWPTPDQEFTALSQFFAGGTRIATGDKKRGVAIWDVAQGKIIKNLQAPAHSSRGGSLDEVTTLTVGEDGKFAAAQIGPSGSSFIWNCETAEVIHEFKSNEQPWGRNPMIFLPDGKTLACANEKNDLVLFDVLAKTQRARHVGIPGMSGHRITSLAATPDGATIAAGMEDGLVHIFSLDPKAK